MQSQIIVKKTDKNFSRQEIKIFMVTVFVSITIDELFVCEAEIHPNI